MALGRGHDLGPGAAQHVHVQVSVIPQVGPHADEPRTALGHRLRRAHICRFWMCVGRRVGIEHCRQHAEIHAVIGYRLKVQGTVELEIHAAGMLSRKRPKPTRGTSSP